MTDPTYESTGVSLATANAVVERLRKAVESTGATGFGHFAGLFPLDDTRLLAASTDGVGSKLMLHRRAGTLRVHLQVGDGLCQPPSFATRASASSGPHVPGA